MKRTRTYHDPLHGAIRLDGDIPAEALVMKLVDTVPFQRLRRVRQLGPAFLTFHGAESSRFTHSSGCCTWRDWPWQACVVWTPASSSTLGCCWRRPFSTTSAMGP